MLNTVAVKSTGLDDNIDCGNDESKLLSLGGGFLILKCSLVPGPRRQAPLAMSLMLGAYFERTLGVIY